MDAWSRLGQWLEFADYPGRGRPRIFRANDGTRRGIIEIFRDQEASGRRIRRLSQTAPARSERDVIPPGVFQGGNTLDF